MISYANVIEVEKLYFPLISNKDALEHCKLCVYEGGREMITFDNSIIREKEEQCVCVRVCVCEMWFFIAYLWNGENPIVVVVVIME